MVPEATGPSEMGFGGLEPKHVLEVTDIEPGMPAEKAGIKIGDVMVALNGKPLLAVGQMIDMLQADQRSAGHFDGFARRPDEGLHSSSQCWTI